VSPTGKGGDKAHPSRPPGRPRRGFTLDRQRVLRSAASLFLSRGYAAVSLDQVAALARVDKKSLHYHFRTKVRLYSEALDAVMEETERIIRDVLREALPLRARVTRLMERLLTESPPLYWYRLSIREAAPDLTPEQLRQIIRRRMSIINVIATAFAMADGSPVLSPSAIAEVMMHLVAAGQHPSLAEVPVHERAQWLTDLVWEGLPHG
jgi:AcrR family transcriptional regulator